MGPYRDFTKIIDFGVVRRFSTNATRLTQPHLFPGTPAFAAPEMVATPDKLTPSADLYSLGCTAYFLLTGMVPFSGDSPFEVLMKHMNEEPVPPSEIKSDIPSWADELVISLMAKKPEDRPVDAKELISITEPISATYNWTMAMAQKWWEEH
jgi:serine/threonine-protein kinase